MLTFFCNPRRNAVMSTSPSIIRRVPSRRSRHGSGGGSKESSSIPAFQRSSVPKGTPLEPPPEPPLERVHSRRSRRVPGVVPEKFLKNWSGMLEQAELQKGGFASFRSSSTVTPSGTIPGTTPGTPAGTPTVNSPIYYCSSPPMYNGLRRQLQHPQNQFLRVLYFKIGTV
jgi:hypothetical protein